MAAPFPRPNAKVPTCAVMACHLLSRIVFRLCLPDLLPVFWQKVSFRHDYDGLGDVALGDTTGPSGRVGLRGKWTIGSGGAIVSQGQSLAGLGS